MAKSRKNIKSIVRSITKTSQKTLPVLDNGIKTVGKAAKTVSQKSIPVIEKGVSAVYDTLAKGFDLGLKGTKSVARGIKIRTKKRRTRRH